MSMIKSKKTDKKFLNNPVILAAIITVVGTIVVALIQYSNSLMIAQLPLVATETAQVYASESAATAQVHDYESTQTVLSNSLSQKYKLEKFDDINGVYSFQMPINIFRVKENPYAYGHYFVSDILQIESQFRYFGKPTHESKNWISVYQEFVNFGRYIVVVPGHSIAFTAPSTLLRSENTNKLPHSTLFEFEGGYDYFANRPDFLPTPIPDAKIRESFLIEEKDDVWAFFIISAPINNYDSMRDIILYMTNTFMWDSAKAKEFAYTWDLNK
jgi:hypothetical protein